MWTVDKFLCCFKLSTGGYVMGILGTISNFIGLICLSVALYCAIFEYPKLIENMRESALDLSSLQQVLESQIALIMTLTVLLAMTCFALYASVSLYQGTKYKNSHKLKPYMVILMLSMVLTSLQLLQFTWNAFCSFATGTILYGYIYICIYSLYLKLRSEHELTFDPATKGAAEKSLP